MKQLLDVRNLETQFLTTEGLVKAVNDVSFSVKPGEVLGIVGESGCGKSVTAQSILQILGPNGLIVNGTITFHFQDGDSVDLAKLDPVGAEIRSIRGKEIAMIFQEPMASLCPIYTIGNQIMEGILLHQNVDKDVARGIAIDMLEKVGISNPHRSIDNYPHQLSGGMKQRAMIAMALACRPRLLIADEPTTALDVTIQAQILNLMEELQREIGMGIMLITHDLGVIAETADHVVVMYLGRTVESAPVKELFQNPLHPYTRALLQSIPRIGTKAGQRLATIDGAVPDAYNIPSGCPFHPRCADFVPGKCDETVPPSVDVTSQHSVSCILVGGEVHKYG